MNNKAEKELAKKVLAFYKSPQKTGYGFTDEENMILESWRVHKKINEEAFVDVTSHASEHKKYIQNQLCYPFTSLGDEERKKNWYLRFRNSTGITIARDILTLMALIFSIYATIATILQSAGGAP